MAKTKRMGSRPCAICNNPVWADKALRFYEARARGEAEGSVPQLRAFLAERYDYKLTASALQSHIERHIRDRRGN